MSSNLTPCFKQFIFSPRCSIVWKISLTIDEKNVPCWFKIKIRDLFKTSSICQMSFHRYVSFKTSYPILERFSALNGSSLACQNNLNNSDFWRKCVSNQSEVLEHGLVKCSGGKCLLNNSSHNSPLEGEIKWLLQWICPLAIKHDMACKRSHQKRKSKWFRMYQQK